MTCRIVDQAYVGRERRGEASRTETSPQSPHSVGNLGDWQLGKGSSGDERLGKLPVSVGGIDEIRTNLGKHATADSRLSIAVGQPVAPVTYDLSHKLMVGCMLLIILMPMLVLAFELLPYSRSPAQIS